MDSQCDGKSGCAEHPGHTDVETGRKYCDDHWSSHLGATVARYFPNGDGKVGRATHTAAILYGDLNAAYVPCGEATSMRIVEDTMTERNPNETAEQQAEREQAEQGGQVEGNQTETEGGDAEGEGDADGGERETQQQQA